MTTDASTARAEALRAGSYDDSAWDGNAAMGACHSAADFRSVCAGEKNVGQPDERQHWALPHHKSPGAAPNRAGTNNALSRLPQTEGLSNRGAAEAHLKAHQKLWAGGQNALTPEEVRSLRSERFGGQRRFRPDDGARLATFAGQFRYEPIVVQGRELIQLDGYASVVEQPYPMWDLFGEYDETVDARAFDKTLDLAPDVAFLVNHKGVTMARSGGMPQTLFLDADPRGLHAQALVNPKRNDVHDMLIAIDDGNLTEMSFAFTIEDWEWDEDFTSCRLLEVSLERGDVSVVNFGANPYTSIAARTQEVMGMLEYLPDGAARAALDRLSKRMGVPARTVERAIAATAEARAASDPDPAVQLGGGRSVALVERLMDLG